MVVGDCVIESFGLFNSASPTYKYTYIKKKFKIILREYKNAFFVLIYTPYALLIL